ncbi:hypothetical protein ASG25_02115 [Rhizobium sp. Leaf384]|uniref:hypothetical protein n=1 Tax=unclassified Rhizobium TaxID=2613769 RepID=UPI0007132F4D|nr:MULTISPECIES: hypothetical protein [unclassified Rhizobium]KQS80428.1 hypothetical protein ASG25_02115 [Rhizobium sp. Leaf384]KQS86477.1 hypothetical protein ASG58_17180 [Rhizobium sp. Leaf383]
MPIPQTNTPTQEAIAMAFALTGPADGVARVARLANHRLAHTTEWAGWCVSSVELSAEVDHLHLATVRALPVGHFAEEATLIFALATEPGRASRRFDALLRACGIVDKIVDDRELVGRYFAMRGRGAAASDFADFAGLFA